MYNISDLGTSLNSLDVLWMQRCSLKCLNGLSGFSNLTEIYFAFNEISDIKACSVLENLEIADFEGYLCFILLLVLETS